MTTDPLTPEEEAAERAKHADCRDDLISNFHDVAAHRWLATLDAARSTATRSQNPDVPWRDETLHYAARSTATPGLRERIHAAICGAPEVDHVDGINAICHRAALAATPTASPTAGGLDVELRKRIESYCKSWVTAVPVDILRAALTTPESPEE